MFLDDANSIILDNYTTVDTRAAYSLRSVTLALEAFNLFDEVWLVVVTITGNETDHFPRRALNREWPSVERAFLSSALAKRATLVLGQRGLRVHAENGSQHLAHRRRTVCSIERGCHDRNAR